MFRFFITSKPRRTADLPIIGDDGYSVEGLILSFCTFDIAKGISVLRINNERSTDIAINRRFCKFLGVHLETKHRDFLGEVAQQFAIKKSGELEMKHEWSMNTYNKVTDVFKHKLHEIASELVEETERNIVVFGESIGKS